jgi:hypothetical protein
MKSIQRGITLCRSENGSKRVQAEEQPILNMDANYLLRGRTISATKSGELGGPPGPPRPMLMFAPTRVASLHQSLPLLTCWLLVFKYSYVGGFRQLNMPRRSRACRACRQRRIGCDGALPSCRQCLVTNRLCSGPVQGTIIIDQTENVKSRYSTMSGKNSIARIVPQPSARRAWLGAVTAPGIFAYVTSAIDVPSRPAWLRQLSEIPLAARGSALDVALEAFAAAYHGVMSNDGSIMLEAWRMYGDALSRQSKAITSHRSEKQSPAVLYTSVIFSLFETICCTNYAAYAAHLAAARKMLALTRSELGQDEVFERVAMHVQYQTV